MRAVPGRVNRYYLPLRGQFCQLARSLFSSRSGPESPRRGGSSGTFTALLVAAFHACMPDCLKLDNQRHRKYKKTASPPALQLPCLAFSSLLFQANLSNLRTSPLTQKKSSLCHPTNRHSPPGLGQTQVPMQPARFSAAKWPINAGGRRKM